MAAYEYTFHAIYVSDDAFDPDLYYTLPEDGTVWTLYSYSAENDVLEDGESSSDTFEPLDSSDPDTVSTEDGPSQDVHGYTDLQGAGEGDFVVTEDWDPVPGTKLHVYGNPSDPDTFVPPTTLSYTDDIITEVFPTCFAPGTGIATPQGPRAVETLAIGDMISTADGRSVPVKWIGRQTLHKRFTPADRLAPVRVTAGALGDGRPHADLVLTADHALILDGLAINASALVNGTTITFDPVAGLPDRVTYYHVETADHEVILANGAPAESYVDYIARAAFDNHAEYLALYGTDRTITEMPLPRISAARMVPPALRARLAGPRAA